jgi:gliding motility-associated-like protein
MLSITNLVSAQDVKVCAGRQSLFRAIGNNGAKFAYDVPEAGKLLRNYNDSILVQWGNTRGIFPIGVQETSIGGCVGDWFYLNVAIVGAEIVFDKEPYVLCNGDVQVNFNEKDFQPAYHWSDPSIKNNIITKPGTYELQAFDLDGCLISKEVTVLASPKVNLGRDTMICTSDFRLYALRPNTNPENTVYTWSTGESGNAPYLDVLKHSTEQDILYWVRAEWNGCTVADTVVVIACKPDENLPDNWNIPNTFTPNGDGENDLWNIRPLEAYPNSTVEVFDRWGRRVFLSKKGYPTPWDGRDIDGHKLPMETYYYIIHLHDGIHTKPVLGTITIVR